MKSGWTLLEAQMALTLTALGFGGLAGVLGTQCRQTALLEARPQATMRLNADRQSFVACSSTANSPAGSTPWATVQLSQLSANDSDSLTAVATLWPADGGH